MIHYQHEKTGRFRGKDKDDKWHFGYHSRSQTGMHLIDVYTQYIGCKANFVKPETIGMFADIQDDNGEDIYTDDLIEIEIDGEKVIVAVMFRAGQFFAYNGNASSSDDAYIELDHFEDHKAIGMPTFVKVGNLHDGLIKNQQP
jgi:hypothetical protein